MVYVYTDYVLEKDWWYLVKVYEHWKLCLDPEQGKCPAGFYLVARRGNLTKMIDLLPWEYEELYEYLIEIVGDLIQKLFGQYITLNFDFGLSPEGLLKVMFIPVFELQPSIVVGQKEILTLKLQAMSRLQTQWEKK